MGGVIRFPERQRISVQNGREDDDVKGARIIILPVIRIERIPDPSDGVEPSTNTPGGKRRRRASRP